MCAGKKRVWIPDEKEAYTEVEIKDTDGDKVMVETKDGMVSVASIAFFFSVTMLIYIKKIIFLITVCLSFQ